eukprot:TRINITY_DN17036_c1_g2_i1.p1 TRINITY_DN17036_c1_g2~~TRINITY_DN17036_c1_g2_i1.p1  ORF type:complete len:1291 (-),score=172.01 TRINITY_DN17036_c1_g2_i1:159-4031(-)
MTVLSRKSACVSALVAAACSALAVSLEKSARPLDCRDDDSSDSCHLASAADAEEAADLKTSLLQVRWRSAADDVCTAVEGQDCADNRTELKTGEACEPKCSNGTIPVGPYVCARGQTNFSGVGCAANTRATLPPSDVDAVPDAVDASDMVFKNFLLLREEDCLLWSELDDRVKQFIKDQAGKRGPSSSAIRSASKLGEAKKAEFFLSIEQASILLAQILCGATEVARGRDAVEGAWYRPQAFSFGRAMEHWYFAGGSDDGNGTARDAVWRHKTLVGYGTFASDPTVPDASSKVDTGSTLTITSGCGSGKDADGGLGDNSTMTVVFAGHYVGGFLPGWDRSINHHAQEEKYSTLVPELMLATEPLRHMGAGLLSDSGKQDPWKPAAGWYIIGAGSHVSFSWPKARPDKIPVDDETGYVAVGTERQIRRRGIIGIMADPCNNRGSCGTNSRDDQYRCYNRQVLDRDLFPGQGNLWGIAAGGYDFSNWPAKTGALMKDIKANLWTLQSGGWGAGAFGCGSLYGGLVQALAAKKGGWQDMRMCWASGREHFPTVASKMGYAVGDFHGKSQTKHLMTGRHVDSYSDGKMFFADQQYGAVAEQLQTQIEQHLPKPTCHNTPCDRWNNHAGTCLSSQRWCFDNLGCTWHRNRHEDLRDYLSKSCNPDCAQSTGICQKMGCMATGSKRCDTGGIAGGTLMHKGDTCEPACPAGMVPAGLYTCKQNGGDFVGPGCVVKPPEQPESPIDALPDAIKPRDMVFPDFKMVNEGSCLIWPELPDAVKAFIIEQASKFGPSAEALDKAKHLGTDQKTEFYLSIDQVSVLTAQILCGATKAADGPKSGSGEQPQAFAYGRAMEHWFFEEDGTTPRNASWRRTTLVGYGTFDNQGEIPELEKGSPIHGDLTITSGCSSDTDHLDGGLADSQTMTVVFAGHYVGGFLRSWDSPNTNGAQEEKVTSVTPELMLATDPLRRMGAGLLSNKGKQDPWMPKGGWYILGGGTYVKGNYPHWTSEKAKIGPDDYIEIGSGRRMRRRGIIGILAKPCNDRGSCGSNSRDDQYRCFNRQVEDFDIAPAPLGGNLWGIAGGAFNFENWPAGAQAIATKDKLASTWLLQGGGWGAGAFGCGTLYGGMVQSLAAKAGGWKTMRMCWASKHDRFPSLHSKFSYVTEGGGRLRADHVSSQSLHEPLMKGIDTRDFHRGKVLFRDSDYFVVAAALTTPIHQDLPRKSCRSIGCDRWNNHQGNCADMIAHCFKDRNCKWHKLRHYQDIRDYAGEHCNPDCRKSAGTCSDRDVSHLTHSWFFR